MNFNDFLDTQRLSQNDDDQQFRKNMGIPNVSGASSEITPPSIPFEQLIGVGHISMPCAVASSLTSELYDVDLSMQMKNQPMIPINPPLINIQDSDDIENMNNSLSEINPSAALFSDTYNKDHRSNSNYLSSLLSDDAASIHSYSSSMYQTPYLNPQDPCQYIDMSYLTTGDDDLDEILSVNSVTSPSPSYNKIEALNDINDMFKDLDDTQNSAMGNSMTSTLSSITPGVVLSLSPTSISQVNTQGLNISQRISKASSHNSFDLGVDKPFVNSASLYQEGSVLTSDDEDILHNKTIKCRNQRCLSNNGLQSLSSSLACSSSPKKRRSLSENRDGLLELVNSNSQFTPNLLKVENDSALHLSGNTKRKASPKNPAIYICELCDKKFTRPYNLKSHLRTHTDERPFSCSICGKSFARQHDRKRHEDLHTGKKRYICGGTLKNGLPWGCGKKFARSDALGRHFKTESGRRCIAPLYRDTSQEQGTEKLKIDDLNNY